MASDIDGREIHASKRVDIVAPHNHTEVLGQVHYAGAKEAQSAVDASVSNAQWWGRLPWEERVAPFLRAADMLEHGPWRATQRGDHAGTLQDVVSG